MPLDAVPQGINVFDCEILGCCCVLLPKVCIGHEHDGHAVTLHAALPLDLLAHSPEAQDGFVPCHRSLHVQRLKHRHQTSKFRHYGESLETTARLAAAHIDKLARGANVAELPIEQPTRFRLTVNLKVASHLGITIPATVLARAESVIE